MKNKFNLIKWLATAIICTFISSVYGQVTIYSQDFSGTYPWGMTTNALGGTSYVWGSGNAIGAGTQPTGSTGDYATADSDNTCGDVWDTELVTPGLDFSPYQSVELNFGSYFEGFFGYSKISVDVSLDNGATWTNLHSEDSYEDQVTTIDLSAYAGFSNVKVRWRYEDYDGCVYWWSIDDIEITGDLPPACTAPPTAGTAVSNAPSVCSQVTLGLNGNTLGQGITYQWQSSSDGLTWTDISGATSPSTIQPISGTTHFRAILTCSGQSDTSAAVSVDLSDFTMCYCMPAYVYSCTDDYTSNVKFGTINNSSSCGGSTPNNYSDYTSISTTVITGNVYPLSVTTDGDDEGVAVWIDYDHSGTFDASELVLNGFAGTTPATYTANVTIPTSALSGPTIMRVRNRYNGTINAGESCTTFNYGETEHYTVDIIPPAADEVGVTAITRPAVSACSLGNQLWVQLQNLGTNNLTSATVEVRVNGLSINTVTWNGSVAAGTSSEVQIPITYAFADADSVSVLVSNPNGQTENPIFTFNNQYGRRLYVGLTGNKTVYGGGADFADINAAVAALTLRGVCDTVHFKIAANTYTTNHTFGPYLNAGPGKLAVFESATGNPADVVFNVPTSAGNNYVFSFNNARYYALRNITAKASGTTYSGVIDFRGDVDHIELGGNIFQGDTTAAYSTSNYNKTLAVTNYNNGNDYDDIWIHNNTFVGGIRSLDFELANAQFSNLVIEKNIFRSYSLLGVITLNTSNVQINGNTFLSRTGITGTQSAAQIVYSYGGGSVSGNKVTMPAAGYGLLFSDVPGSGNRMLVSNNFVYSGDTTASATSNGIYVRI